MGVGGLAVPFYFVQDGSFSLDSLATLPYQWFQFSLFKIEGKDSHKYSNCTQTMKTE